MNEILNRYKERKFNKCLELINSLKASDNDVENFSLESCRLVCESFVKIDENNADQIFEMQEQHYLFFEKIILVGASSHSIPLELRLNSTFNFIFWLLFYTDVDLGPSEEEEYLELINKGLLSVLGKEFMSENSSSNSAKNILNNLMCLKKLIINERHKTTLFILELVIVIIVYLVTVRKSLLKDCLKIVSAFIKESKHTEPDKFLQVKPASLDLIKFSLDGSGYLLSDLNSNVINYLHLLESTFLFLLEDFKGSLKSLQKNMQTHVPSMWNYLVVLNSYELGNWNMCFRFLFQMSSLALHKCLKARCHIMEGRLNCVERKHKEALRQFNIALSLSPNCPIIYYYTGEVYGKMGLTDSMVEHFEILNQVIHNGDPGEDLKPNFESTLLEWIHPVNEITEAESLFALAVSYGLNEDFKSAAEIFEKVLECLEGEVLEEKKGIIELPNYQIILHEASLINLLLGNLVRAEQLSLDAIDRYIAKKSPEVPGNTVSFLRKDIEWLERIIQHELLDTDLEPKQTANEILYTEDLLLFLSQDVIALLILSEIQRIQEMEDYKSTLNNVFSIFSKYLAIVHKKEDLDEIEKHGLTLVKALAGKTCVRIANLQVKEENDSNVEKMFKRALSCNRGDRDALYNYYNFLLKIGKNREALKLWNTFSKEKVAIGVDSLQSFSLRYFLTDKITDREFEKVQREIEGPGMKFS